MYRGKKKSLLSLLFVLIIPMLTVWAAEIQSQEKYPTRAIDFIVALAPGSGTDFMARVLADFAKKEWGVPINVINKPGGNTVPANLEVHRAKPDGYTILCNTQANCSFLEVSTRDLPFKVLDRTFIANVCAAPCVLFVNSTSSVKNMKDLEAEVKRDPENFTWGSFGGVGTGDFYMRLFFRAIGVDVSKTRPVTVRGSGETMTLAAGGHIKVGPSSPPGGLPYVKAGTLRPVVVTTPSRAPEFPDVATAKEQGYPTLVVWYGISGPPNLPDHIVAKWDEVVQQMLKDQGIVSKLKNVGLAPFYLNSSNSRKLVEKEMEDAKELWGFK